MTPPNEQPVLPGEGLISDLEALFIAEQPQRLFPINQNSNFGAVRKVFTSEAQVATDLLAELFNELFIKTSVGYLSRWEGQAGLPNAAAGFSDSHRRVQLLSRRTRGLFTRARVNALVQNFIIDTFGVGADFGALGIPIVGGGVSLFSGVTSLIGTYRIYEDVQNYAYSVWIESSITPDLAGLNRELTWLTPSGIAYTIDNAHADVLSYFRLVRNSQPLAYWRMGTLNDTSGYVNTLTALGGAVAGGLAAPGLLHANVADGEAAVNLDGVDDSFSAPHNAQLDFTGGSFTLEMWIQPDVLPASLMGIMGKYFGGPNSGWDLTLGTNGKPRMTIRGTSNIDTNSAHGASLVGVTTHLVFRCSPTKIEQFNNGVKVGETLGTWTPAYNTEPIRIGRRSTVDGLITFDGKLDEIALYDGLLSDAVILDHYNTGIDTATY